MQNAIMTTCSKPCALPLLNQWQHYNAADDGFGNVQMVGALAWSASHYHAYELSDRAMQEQHPIQQEY